MARNLIITLVSNNFFFKNCGKNLKEGLNIEHNLNLFLKYVFE